MPIDGNAQTAGSAAVRRRFNATLRLNLGCGDDLRPGFVNHDRSRHRRGVDVVHDLRVYPWPWESTSATEVLMLDVLEHLPDTIAALDECWRVLAPDGALHVRVPHYQHENAWLDPTHVRPFHPKTFDYFDPYTELGGTYGFYTPRKWRVMRRRIVGGNIEVRMRPVKEVRRGRGWSELEWHRRAAVALGELAAVVPPGETVIVVDDGLLSPGAVLADRHVLPMVERAGEYWGAPTDDDEALAELDRLCRRGARYFAVAWTAFWWLLYYERFADFLDSAHEMIWESSRMAVFRLQDMGESHADASTAA